VRRWLAACAGLSLALLLVPGCPDQTAESCGAEPDTDVCGRLTYECGTATVCYACGVARRVDCGSCAKEQTCGGGGVPHVCWPPLDAGADDAAAAVDGGPDTDAGPHADAGAGADAADAGPDAAAKDAGDGGDAGPVVDASLDATSAEASLMESMVLCPDDAAPPGD